MELFSEKQEMLCIAQPKSVGHLEVEQSVVEVDGGAQAYSSDTSQEQLNFHFIRLIQ